MDYLSCAPRSSGPGRHGGAGARGADAVGDDREQELQLGLLDAFADLITRANSALERLAWLSVEHGVDLTPETSSRASGRLVRDKDTARTADLDLEHEQSHEEVPDDHGPGAGR